MEDQPQYLIGLASTAPRLPDSVSLATVFILEVVVTGDQRRTPVANIDVSLSLHFDSAADRLASGVGNFCGTGSVTLPVATHSVPRVTID